MYGSRSAGTSRAGAKAAGLAAAVLLAAGLGAMALLGAAALLVPAPAAAQEDYSTRLGITLGGGAAKYGGDDRDHLDLGGLYHLGVRVGWKRRIDIESNLRYGAFNAVELPDLTLDIKNQTTEFDLGVVYSHRPDSKWTPQAFGGLGILYWQVVDLTNESSSGIFGDGPVLRGLKNDGHPEILSDANLAMFFGLGTEFEVTSQVYLRLGARVDFLPQQDTDNTGASAVFEGFQANLHADANNWFGSGFAGVTYFFGARDSDNDGLTNKEDPCPYEAEDIDGFEDADGCPDPDNDGDGILDVDDQCPDEAEDIDGFEDEDGCPDPDNDGDGVLDADDQCPDEAEDADGFQDEDGCPDPDNDGDGVLDVNDQCDGTPQGVPVDTLGCPTVARIDTVSVLEKVRFRPGTAELDSAAMAVLDSIALSLRAYPDVELEIQAHTSDVGPAARNLTLSQRRAEAVAQYLVDHGVEARRLTPIGYGEDEPMVPNDSPANRAKNERIVLVPQMAPVEGEGLDEDLELEIEMPDDGGGDDGGGQ